MPDRGTSPQAPNLQAAAAQRCGIIFIHVCRARDNRKDPPIGTCHSHFRIDSISQETSLTLAI